MNEYDFCICKTQLKDETDKHRCNYWFHQTKSCDDSILPENYCVTKHILYDGRIDSLCKRCQRYADAFVAYPEFLEICIQLFRETDGLDIRDVIDDDEIKRIFDRLDGGESGVCVLEEVIDF